MVVVEEVEKKKGELSAPMGPFPPISRVYELIMRRSVVVSCHYFQIYKPLCLQFLVKVGEDFILCSSKNVQRGATELRIRENNRLL